MKWWECFAGYLPPPPAIPPPRPRPRRNIDGYHNARRQDDQVKPHLTTQVAHECTLRVSIGDWELEVEGSKEQVERYYDSFLDAIAARYGWEDPRLAIVRRKPHAR